MLVDIRPSARLSGPEPIDVAAVLGPVLEALREDGVDLERVRVVCDWIQYRNNFRQPVDLRPVLAAPDAPEDLEVAVDLRRCGDGAVAGAATREALAAHRDPAARVRLGDWGPGRTGPVWDFNALYWRELALWERDTGRGYEQALPGGRSDARNEAGARELIGELIAVWDELTARGELPETLYVAELGVGNGNQARTWLDTFLAMDRERRYYPRLHYLMGDYAPRVLEQARAATGEHADRVSTLVLDATRPAATLGFLRGRAFLVYLSNVYDNLPTDEVARIGGRPYRVETRAYLPAGDSERIAGGVRAEPGDLPRLAARLLKAGPELLAEALPRHFSDTAAAVRFWRDCWAALRLEERYVPLPVLADYEPAPSVPGESLGPVLEAGGDVRMQVSNGALASLTDTLRLLHPRGRVHCHDLFVTDPRRYAAAFCGPGKYDGSVVNWVNGPLLRDAAARHGCTVSYRAFTHRERSNIVTLTASPDATAPAALRSA
ncbi:MAG: hypothetical protein GEV11_20305 [Streptosporangiales bacterium]|nr:hypothetical protein [Streptosporangiales bacterium]